MKLKYLTLLSLFFTLILLSCDHDKEEEYVEPDVFEMNIQGSSFSGKHLSLDFEMNDENLNPDITIDINSNMELVIDVPYSSLFYVNNKKGETLRGYFESLKIGYRGWTNSLETLYIRSGKTGQILGTLSLNGVCNRFLFQDDSGSLIFNEMGGKKIASFVTNQEIKGYTYELRGSGVDLFTVKHISSSWEYSERWRQDLYTIKFEVSCLPGNYNQICALVLLYKDKQTNVVLARDVDRN